MRWSTRLIATLLAVLWLPATSLCLVERAGWLAKDDCCPSSSQKSPTGHPSGGTPCCTLASATYKTDDDRPIVWGVPPEVLLAECALIQPAEGLYAPQSASCSSLPPELPTTWRFSHRAAAPPRAPSFVS